MFDAETQIFWPQEHKKSFPANSVSEACIISFNISQPLAEQHSMAAAKSLNKQ